MPRRTGESNLRRRRVGPMLYQLSYIPTLPVAYGLFTTVQLFQLHDYSKGPAALQALSYDRHSLTSPPESVLCL